jgi:4-amino-4-deoxy-L-arabinose transferase-like glycosyltransferase
MTAASQRMARTTGETTTANHPGLLRWLKGLSLFSLGTGALFVMMAREGRLPQATLWGLAALALAAFGLLQAFGLFSGDVQAAPSWWGTACRGQPGEPAWASPRFTVPLSAGLLAVFGPGLGADRLPWVIAAALAVLALSAVRRPALLLFVVASALFLPSLGVYGLWDPWETHYGEVAREILARDDWISLWWAQDGWFWSKPILIFWSEALNWRATALDFRPDRVAPHVEWIIRVPTYLMTVGALLAVYAATARYFTRRAALVCGLVLATTPHFFFQAHQAISDMPFVASMTIAISLLLLAVGEEPERTVKSYRIGSFLVSGQHLVIAALLGLVLPQILYLVTRNVTLIDGPMFAWHVDQFLSGSGGNDGIPGNAAARLTEPRYKALWFQPAVQALPWSLGLLALLWLLRKEHRAQALYMFGFYIFCALAFMGKGIAGVGFPGLVALMYLLACNRWSLMLEGRLRIAAGALTVSVVSLPWFVAMYVRHGNPFTNRLLIHDHINRLAAGVHGDKGSIEYFLEHLGFGMFPWIALWPAALAGWFYWRSQRRSEPGVDRGRRETFVVHGLWLAATFTLFSAMVTKFHHYIFPAVPPAAVLVGLALDRMLGELPREASRARRGAAVATGMVAPVFWVLALAGLYGDVRGVLPEGLTMAETASWVHLHPWPTATCFVLLGAGVALAAISAWLGKAGDTAAGSNRRLSFGAALFAGVVLCAFVGRDFSWKTSARPAGFERLIHLFVYNYDRPWPEQFDYRAVLVGFALVATVCCAAGALAFLRPLMMRALLGTALFFAFWCLDIYMIDLSPHWGQRELVARYYRERKGPAEPLVAWQMNWKGENFYSGNRVAVFTSLNNDAIKKWLEDNAGKRAFFILEHTRLGRFRSLLSPRKVRELTSKRDCNKFLLVSAGL